jgi:tetratricopeptide (TPR) repeat protein
MTQCHADLSKAIQLSPDFVQGIGKKAKLLVQDAEFDAARALYERLLELRQGDQKAMQTLQDIEKGRQYLAYSKDLFAQNRHEEAVAYLDPLLEIAPNCIDARLMRANGQHLLGRPEGVLADTGKVLKMQVGRVFHPAIPIFTHVRYQHALHCQRFGPRNRRSTATASTAFFCADWLHSE